MKYSVVSILAPIALLGVALMLTDADAAIRLKTGVVVDGVTITLGDVLEGAGTKSSVPVAEAPPPGGRLILRVARISALARKHGLDWPQTAIRIVHIVRASTIVPEREVISKIKEALADAGVPGSITLNFSGKSQRIHVPVGAEASLAVDDIRFNRNTGHFSAIVRAPAENRRALQIELKGRVYAVMDIPVLVNRVPIGDKITKHDIGWIKVRLDRTGRGTVTNAEDMIGMAPKRFIRTNSPIRSADLRRPIVIAKGSTVTMVVSASGMTLAMLGRALDNGGIGDAISVMNSHSRKIVEGVITGPGRIEIRLY
jgi:flagella basal body P-ring formation protein FlgA